MSDYKDPSFFENQSEGHMITRAIDKTDNVLDIDEVPNGEACGCFCPYCKKPLIAKNGGEIRAHHFAHRPGEECNHGYEASLKLRKKGEPPYQEPVLPKEETELPPPKSEAPHVNEGELHAKAKRFLSYLGEIRLPLSYKDYEISPENIPAIRITATSTEQTFQLGGTAFRPDVTLTLEGGAVLYVEIFVTHGVDGEKDALIAGERIPMLEIDLNQYTGSDDDALRSFLQKNLSAKRWVYPLRDFAFSQDPTLLSEIHYLYNHDNHLYSNRDFVLGCPQKPVRTVTSTSSVDCLRCPYHLGDAYEEERNQITCRRILCTFKSKNPKKEIQSVHKAKTQIARLLYKDGTDAFFPVSGYYETNAIDDLIRSLPASIISISVLHVFDERILNISLLGRQKRTMATEGLYVTEEGRGTASFILPEQEIKEKVWVIIRLRTLGNDLWQDTKALFQKMPGQ